MIYIRSMALLFIGLCGLLACSNGADGGNRDPVISNVFAIPPTIAIGDSAALSCIADDPEGAPLTYTWDPSDGRLVGSERVVIWYPPTISGNYRVSVTVEDGQGGSDFETVTIAVRPN